MAWVEETDHVAVDHVHEWDGWGYCWCGADQSCLSNEDYEAETGEAADRYMVEAQWRAACPDDCGYLIEPGLMVTPVDTANGTMWVLAEHLQG